MTLDAGRIGVAGQALGIAQVLLNSIVYPSLKIFLLEYISPDSEKFHNVVKAHSDKYFDISLCF